MGRVQLVAIGEADLVRVGRFLFEHLNPRITADSWARSIRPSWQCSAPNHGYMLLAGETVVGVYVAFYSTRLVNGRAERFCNLGPWCVLPEYRLNGIKLLLALLDQRGYHFTDLSPSGSVVPLNQRLGFVHLDTTSALMINLPWFGMQSKLRVSPVRSRSDGNLKDCEREIFDDHRQASAAHHAMITDGERSCYVIFRRDRRKGWPLFASVLYVGNAEVFLSAIKQFRSYLFVHHGIPFTLIERRIVGEYPVSSIILKSARPRMFKSHELRAEQIDYLYSELVCIAW